MPKTDNIINKPLKPEWLRLPLPGKRCPVTGLSRSTLCELIIPGPANDHRPPVKSALIRKRGASRGIRLVSFDSLQAYLNKLADSATESLQIDVEL